MNEAAVNFGQTFNNFMQSVELDSNDLLNKLIAFVNPNVQYAGKVVEILRLKLSNVSDIPS